jgi:methionine synthase I (cobalamin-dependent)/5,10-methylenetetrahydrofolate reductase
MNRNFRRWASIGPTIEEPMDHPFLRRLASGPVLADGAMGTELFRRGITSDQCLDTLNLGLPDVVQQIHRDYISAGADMIETNTFGANRFRLEAYGLADQVREINRAGAAIARESREIMGETVFVAGAIGPSGAMFRPIGSVSYAEVGEAAKYQIEALVEKGVDLIVCETFTDLEEIVAVIEAANAVSDLPIIAELSFDDARRVASGHDVRQVYAALRDLGVAVVGINCGVGPRQALDLLAQLHAISDRPIALQPNAGYPVRVGGRVSYVASPEYFASFARTAIEAGASIVGGCCGTSPEHIRAMRSAVRADRPAEVVVVASPRPPEPVPAPTRDVEPRTRLMGKLERGEFVVSVEVDPPKGSNPAKALRGAALLRDAGVDLINIGDSPMAKVRMSGLGLGLLIQQQVGVETLLHLTSRDRNLMALQSDLLGMHAVGIRHVLALTGDQLRSSLSPPVTAVWDVDSIGLVGILKRLNSGVDYSGTSIGNPTRFVIACAVSPNSDDLDQELARFRQKIDAGANLTLSQPLFSMDQLERFLERVGILPIPHLLGIVPLESYRQAEMLHHEVPGFSIPDDIRERMRLAGDRGADEGLRIAEELIDAARSFVSGVYIITSYGRYDAAASLVRKVVAHGVVDAAS